MPVIETPTMNAASPNGNGASANGAASPWEKLPMRNWITNPMPLRRKTAPTSPASPFHPISLSQTNAIGTPASQTPRGISCCHGRTGALLSFTPSTERQAQTTAKTEIRKSPAVAPTGANV